VLGKALRHTVSAVALTALLVSVGEAQARAAGTAPAKRNLVVVDPGHGGIDPGARGPGGTLEKDVTLAIGRRLAAILRDDPAFDVRMTRDRDTLIALRDRPRMANRWRADGQPALFISIHLNAHPRNTVRGVETYFLSEALTEDARRVAAMENAAERFDEPRSASGDALSFIFNDLRQNHYLRESSDWAAAIQTRLRQVHPGPDRGVKQAGFVVLEGALMPSVLVEVGFISNADEERLLRSPQHQQKVAESLAASVREHFRRTRAQTIARQE
jgi:N-acetylmuramoyl-L-alanine amidase